MPHILLEAWKERDNLDKSGKGKNKSWTNAFHVMGSIRGKSGLPPNGFVAAGYLASSIGSEEQSCRVERKDMTSD